MKTETPMKLAASSEFLSSDTYSLWYIQQRKLSLPSFEQHGVAFPLIVTESDILPGRCSCHPPPAFGLACFWVSSHSPKDGTDRHCRRAWQAEANPSRTAGTSRRTSAGLFAEARPPAASSWCVPNTFPPAATDVHILHTGDVFPNASPQNTSCIAPPSQMVAAGR